ncbi:hypothetical protein FCV25MIE_10517 [Fagus crenata]
MGVSAGSSNKVTGSSTSPADEETAWDDSPSSKTETKRRGGSWGSEIETIRSSASRGAKSTHTEEKGGGVPLRLVVRRLVELKNRIGIFSSVVCRLVEIGAVVHRLVELNCGLGFFIGPITHRRA